jgi:nitroimidazol reductase NimA-like FMN-containing flavoprotein (pyridoxamine 5'-phosphate oxidase superfamily)
MLWDDEAEALVERVNTRIPTFVRGMVRRVIAKESERLALEGGAARVTAAHVRSAYLTRTPAPMQPFLAAALGDGAGGPDAAAEAPEFPVGEPMTPADIEEFLAWEGTGRLGTSGRDGQPYVVPLSFVHDEGAIYYHWFAEDGRKVRAIRENARVCFEADWATRDQLSYRSVIADGVIEEITDLARTARTCARSSIGAPSRWPRRSGSSGSGSLGSPGRRRGRGRRPDAHAQPSSRRLTARGQRSDVGVTTEKGRHLGPWRVASFVLDFP